MLRLIEGWVTLNSPAVAVRLRCLAAASNMNSPLAEGLSFEIVVIRSAYTPTDFFQRFDGAEILRLWVKADQMN